MSDNPLAGLKIPSLEQIVEQAVSYLGIRTVDLANPLERRRFKDRLEQCLSMALDFKLKRALEAATERAVEHVFRVMKDAEYQEKRHKHREKRRKASAEKREQREEQERQARMDYSRKKLEIKKATIQ
jgi:hypothetical protein